MKHPIIFGALLLALSGCTTTETASTSQPLANISFGNTPNDAEVGVVNPDSSTIDAVIGTRIIIGGFRARDCMQTPDFADFIRSEVDQGLRVPDGVTLYDAGVGRYESARCSGTVPARAIGLIAEAPGSYELRFLRGQVVKTIEVAATSGGTVAPEEQRFRGEWRDYRGNRGALILRANAEGVATIEFFHTSCRGRRTIPSGELSLVDGRLSIVGDGNFEIDIGGTCGPASVAAKETTDGELRLDFRRSRHNDTFFATISRT